MWKNTGQNKLVGSKPWIEMEVYAKKLKEKIQENQKTVKKSIHRQMIMDGGEGKKLKKCCVVENIEPHQKSRESDEIRENEEIVHLCIILGWSKAVRKNGGIAPMCLRLLRSKALREVWYIAPMGQWELAHLCLRLGRSKAVRRNGGIDPMCLI